MARKRFTVHSRSLRSFLFDGWLVKLIMKGFGWHYQGDDSPHGDKEEKIFGISPHFSVYEKSSF